MSEENSYKMALLTELKEIANISLPLKIPKYN